MIDVPAMFTLSVVYMTTDAMPSGMYGQLLRVCNRRPQERHVDLLAMEPLDGLSAEALLESHGRRERAGTGG